MPYTKYMPWLTPLPELSILLTPTFQGSGFTIVVLPSPLLVTVTSLPGLPWRLKLLILIVVLLGKVTAHGAVEFDNLFIFWELIIGLPPATTILLTAQ